MPQENEIKQKKEPKMAANCPKVSLPLKRGCRGALRRSSAKIQPTLQMSIVL